MGPQSDPGLATILTGPVVVLLAAFVPYWLLIVLPLIEVAALEGFGGRALPRVGRAGMRSSRYCARRRAR